MSDLDYYLRDVIAELLDRARGTRADHEARRVQAGDDGARFESGRASAYHEVASYLIQQLDAFGIDRARLDVPADLDVAREPS